MTARFKRTTRSFAAIAALMLAATSLGGCIIVEPRHHYGYYY